MLSTEEQALLENIPVWGTATFTFAVWSGLIGSVLLLLKKQVSKIVLIISLIGILVQMIHSLFISNNYEV